MEQGRDGLQLYSEAELYDIAYEWDVTRELCFFIACMQLFGEIDPHRLLEPACGTGRNMESFANMGLEVTGYDVCQETIDFAHARLDKANLLHQCQLHHGDMRTFSLDETFDGAYNAINSFRYLIRDEDVHAHFKAMHHMLKPGAVYVIDLSYAMPPRMEPKVYRWDNYRNGLHVDVCWTTREDRAARISHETCTLDVEQDDGSQHRHLETQHTTRLWLADEFEDAVKKGGFSLECIYDAQFRPIAGRREPDGRQDNLYHVLRRQPR
jgi:SAM-dependent methyltransferase